MADVPPSGEVGPWLMMSVRTPTSVSDRSQFDNRSSLGPSRFCRAFLCRSFTVAPRNADHPTTGHSYASTAPLSIAPPLNWEPPTALVSFRARDPHPLPRIYTGRISTFMARQFKWSGWIFNRPLYTAPILIELSH
ncbi:hypothetical protein AVEN_203105-1 [Araneus ventricosus]|uniref:Uncharacterized protein n=1 Tax=Araneus ventricosus TaxID=182803 RepID=A0A4Y2DSL7_ARAVE|nr:hypothetical protein AVEN_203105-1 [Araneus ventricosus]